MTDATVPEEELAKKPSKLPMIIGLVLALVGGGGGFFAVSSGLLFGGGDHGETQHAEDEHVVDSGPLPDISFVSMPQIVVTLGPGSLNKNLIFRADLEVPKGKVADVEMIMPRVVDVLNSYLRALEPRDIEKPSSLVRLRAQMLRRIQLVAGEDRVRDLLVMEFVLN
ncbi:flagellar basal body-associated FliL family protein [Puniceibacterium sediminis]|uniref:Flagellar protein FliL n=1 Tax=Puniceibacterium sediminis TaxID=1608407 RepID=A0A238VSS2_9RHOB|nr:flagellar basal body-associated FliL family protein [Puniceibacterium sediminis]SNR37288.1 flagellar FliL protein [Puniceibacterium sediminis]